MQHTGDRPALVTMAGRLVPIHQALLSRNTPGSVSSHSPNLKSLNSLHLTADTKSTSEGFPSYPVLHRNTQTFLLQNVELLMFSAQSAEGQVLGTPLPRLRAPPSLQLRGAVWGRGYFSL